MRIVKGTVKSIKVISSDVKIKSFDAVFLKNIESAVRSWRFQPSINAHAQRLSVMFRAVLCRPDESNSGYYTFKVEGVDEGIWQTPPTRITIEYHDHMQVTD
jgi:hypothetical protein